MSKVDIFFIAVIAIFIICMVVVISVVLSNITVMDEMVKENNQEHSELKKLTCNDNPRQWSKEHVSWLDHYNFAINLAMACELGLEKPVFIEH